jgi:hypothetical protein
VFVCFILIFQNWLPIAVSLSSRQAKRQQLKLLTNHLASVGDSARQVKEAANDTTARSIDVDELASTNDWSSIVSTLGHVFSCYHAEYSRADHDYIMTYMLSLLSALTEYSQVAQIRADIGSMVSTLKRCNDPRLVSLVAPVIEPALRAILEHLLPTSPLALPNGVSRARVWTYIGLLRLHCLMPAIPIDPTVNNRVRLADEQKQEWELASAIDIRRWLELLSSGGSQTNGISLLQSNQRDTQVKIDRLSTKVTIRRDGARPFGQLATSVRNYIATLADVPPITKLLKELLPGASSRVALDTERNWQASSEQWIERFHREYGSHYPDFTQPILLAVHQMKYGMAMLAQYTRSKPGTTSSPLYRAIRALVCFPSGQPTKTVSYVTGNTSTSIFGNEDESSTLGALHVLMDINVLTSLDTLGNEAIAMSRERSSDNKDGIVDELSGRHSFRSLRMDVLLLVLRRAHLLIRTSKRMTTPLLSMINKLFVAFIVLWKQLTAAAAEKKQKDDDIKYKYKDRSVIESKTDEEKEDEAIKELYPDYDSEFNDITGPKADDLFSEKKKPTAEEEAAAAELKLVQDDAPLPTLSDEVMAEIYQIFTTAFTSSAVSGTTASIPPTVEQLDRERVSVFTAAYEAASTILHGVKLTSASLPGGLDETLLSAHMFMVSSTFKQLDPFLSSKAANIQPLASQLAQTATTSFFPSLYDIGREEVAQEVLDVKEQQAAAAAAAELDTNNEAPVAGTKNKPTGWGDMVDDEDFDDVNMPPEKIELARVFRKIDGKKTKR